MSFFIAGYTLAQDGDVIAPPSAEEAPPAPSGDNAGPATTATTGQPGTVNQPPPQEGNNSSFMIQIGLIVLVFVGFYMLVIMPNNKKRKKQQEEISQLKKNDKVQTIGGIIGTIVDLKENEVTIKVDEASNTRMRFRRSAIAGPYIKEETIK